MDEGDVCREKLEVGIYLAKWTNIFMHNAGMILKLVTPNNSLFNFEFLLLQFILILKQGAFSIFIQFYL